VTTQAWRRRNPEKRAEQRERYYAKTAKAPNRYLPWTDEETAALLAHEGTDAELSAKIGRGVRAIQVKRNRLKENS